MRQNLLAGKPPTIEKLQNSQIYGSSRQATRKK